MESKALEGRELKLKFFTNKKSQIRVPDEPKLNFQSNYFASCANKLKWQIKTVAEKENSTNLSLPINKS